MDIQNPTYKTGLVPQAASGEASRIQEPPFALPFDTIIHGRYLIGRVLGFGGFGITYQGMNIETNQFVAIKEYYPNGMVSRYPGTTQVSVISSFETFSKEKDKFLQEARIIYHCRNSHILHIYSLFEENGTAYYVMEFLEGRDLMHYLKDSGGRIDWRELYPITLQIMEALEVVHKEGIIHRDISPDNIYLCSDNTAKIIDFGTARSVYDGKSKSVILKKGYAPIEQYAKNGTQGPWTDVYALGATLYRSLTGKIPVEATQRQMQDTLQRPSELGIQLPQNVENAIMQALCVREANRFQSMAAFRASIEVQKNPITAFFDSLTGNKGAAPQTKSLADTLTEYVHAWARLNPVLKGMSGVYAGQTFQLDSDIIFGRDPANCNIVFPPSSVGVSRVHCQICMNVYGQKAVLIDCNSTYGTFLNGMRVYPGQPAVLTTGSVISFGTDNSFSFSL